MKKSLSIRSENLALVLSVLALVIALALTTQHFASIRNVLNVLQAASIVSVLAVGAAFVIAAGGIDLSVGSVATATACIAFTLIRSVFGEFEGVLPNTLVLLATLIVGVMFGAINGFLIGRWGMQPFIVTLAMMGIARGAALIATSGRQIYGVPSVFSVLGQGMILGLPIIVLVALVVGVIGRFIYTTTAFGLRTSMLGDNHAALAACGVSVRRHNFLLYVFSGLLAAIAGVLAAGRVNAIDPSYGVSLELSAITAAVLGGASLAGGKASIGGALMGSIFMALIQNGLNLHAVPSFYQHVVLGSILLVSTWFQQRGRCYR